MANELRDFVSHIKEVGIAKPNKFIVQLSLPQVALNKLGTDGVSAPRTLSIMAQNISVSGTNVNTLDSILQTSTRKIAYDKTTGELDITFLCGGDMLEKRAFDAWIASIFLSNHTVEYYDNYTQNFTITQVNDAGNVIYKADIIDAYPITITQIVLDQTQSNSTQSFQVSFAVRKIIPRYDNKRDNTVDEKTIPSPVVATGIQPITQTLTSEYKNINNDIKDLSTTFTDTVNGSYMNLSINRIINYDGLDVIQSDIEQLRDIVINDIQNIDLGDISLNELSTAKDFLSGFF